MLKQTLLIVLATFMSGLTYASEMTTVETHYSPKGSERVTVTLGFMMDGFDSIDEYSFCFTGNKRDVCSIVYDGYYESITDFEKGGHELMQVFSCTAHLNDENIVSVDVLLRNDYDGQQRKKIKITECKK